MSPFLVIIHTGHLVTPGQSGLRASGAPLHPPPPFLLPILCAVFYPGPLRFAINKCCSFVFILTVKEERWGEECWR